MGSSISFNSMFKLYLIYLVMSNSFYDQQMKRVVDSLCYDPTATYRATYRATYIIQLYLLW